MRVFHTYKCLHEISELKTSDPCIVIKAMAWLSISSFLYRQQHLLQPFLWYLQQTISLLHFQFPHQRNLLSKQHQKSSDSRFMHPIFFQFRVPLKMQVVDFPEHSRIEGIDNLQKIRILP